MQKRRTYRKMHGTGHIALWLICTMIALVPAYYGGKGLYHVVHPHANHSPRTIATRLLQKKSHANVPVELRGSYVSYFPVKTASLRPYYQTASLVHITRDTIYQQLLIVKKRPRATIQKVHEHKGQPRYKTARSNIPNSVKTLMNQTHLQYRFKSMNTSTDVKSIHTKNNAYTVSLGLSYRSSDYSEDALSNYYGSSKPYIVPPQDNKSVKLISDDYGFIANGYHYHHITSQRAKQLLTRNGSIASYFDGYQKMK